MAKFKQKANKISDKRNVGPNNTHKNPRKLKGNPTKGTGIAGKWHKPKLK